MANAKNGPAKGLKGKRQPYPFAPSRIEMGRRFREAIKDAGYSTFAEAVRAVDEALKGRPGATRFRDSDLSNILGGHREMGAGKWIGLAAILGLDVRIIAPELFDGHGRPITRNGHPELFIDGHRHDDVTEGDAA